METITILTPTYNRASYLPRLYESLLAQTGRDFLWLVVDDGSEDNTEKLIASLGGSDFKIRYIRQKNAGKHTALNRGIGEIQTELTFIVDSDDYLPETAVETILRCHEKYRGRSDLCGYSFLRCHSDGRVNTAYFPTDELIGSYAQVRINGGIGGDKAEVFFTEILKRYPFPVFPGEKYLPEDLVWMRMSGPYQMVHINQNIYFCDYLENGLTNTGRRMKIRSPRGMALRSQVYLKDPSVRFQVKLKMMLLYQIYGRFAGRPTKELKGEIGQRLLWLLCRAPAFLLWMSWKRAYEKPEA